MNINLSSVPREKKGEIEKIMRNCIKMIQRKRDKDRDRECFRKLYKDISLALILYDFQTLISIRISWRARENTETQVCGR